MTALSSPTVKAVKVGAGRPLCRHCLMRPKLFNSPDLCRRCHLNKLIRYHYHPPAGRCVQCGYALGSNPATRRLDGRCSRCAERDKYSAPIRQKLDEADRLEQTADVGPTDGLPGTPLKMAVMAKRLAARRCLFHDQDRKHKD